jgi:hypothetical protein
VELISMATTLFQRFGRPPDIQIDNSPGAMPTVVEIDRNNSSLFDVLKQEVEELDPVALECSIYHLNMKIWMNTWMP